VADYKEADPQGNGFPAPLRYNQFLMWGARLYWAQLGRIVPLFFVGYVIALAAVTLGGTPRGLSPSAQIVLVLVRLAVPLTIVGSILVVAAALLMTGHLVGESLTVGSVLASIRGRLRDVLAAALLVSILGILFLMIFGVQFGLVLIFALLGPPVVGHAVVVEHKRLGAAWAHSKRLLAMQAARVFLYLWPIALLLTFLMFPGWSVSDYLGRQIGGIGGYAAGLMLGAAVAAILLPFLAALSLVVYFELRARAEDFDINQLRAEFRASEA
jgi:hypothetical protein